MNFTLKQRSATYFLQKVYCNEDIWLLQSIKLSLTICYRIQFSQRDIMEIGVFGNTYTYSVCLRQSRILMQSARVHHMFIIGLVKGLYAHIFSKNRQLFKLLGVGVKIIFKAIYKYLFELPFVDIAYELKYVGKHKVE